MRNRAIEISRLISRSDAVLKLNTAGTISPNVASISSWPFTRAV
jgi:hypothetical protein